MRYFYFLPLLALAGCSKSPEPPAAVAAPQPQPKPRIAAAPTAEPTPTFPPVQIGPAPGATAAPDLRPDIQYARHISGVFGAFSVLEQSLKRASNTMAFPDIQHAQDDAQSFQKIVRDAPPVPPKFRRIQSRLVSVSDEIRAATLNLEEQTPAGLRKAARHLDAAGDGMDQISVEMKLIKYR